jgi:hypothetical protein
MNYIYHPYRIRLLGDEAMSDGTVKLSVNLSEEVVNALRNLATTQGTTMTEVLRKAISTEKVLQDASSRNAKILIEEPDNTVKQLLLR